MAVQKKKRVLNFEEGRILAACCREFQTGNPGFRTRRK
jgi:hypothetical protein